MLNRVCNWLAFIVYSMNENLLTLMINCRIVSNGESAGKVFVMELPSGRRNWRRAVVLKMSKRYNDCQNVSTNE